MKLEKWKTISSKKCCENQWISVREDKVRLPDGNILDSYIVIDYCGAVAILASQKNKILLVKQFRYAINKFTLEIPAGNLIGPGRKNIIKSARTELLEESGYVARAIEPFYSYRPSPGSSNEVIHLTRAIDVEKRIKVSNFGVDWYSVESVFEMVKEGKIVHSPTIIGVLLGREMGFFDA